MEQQKIDIWLDCDPGHDDMMAIILAGYNENINLLGISTVGGNNSIDMVTTNALKTIWFAGMKNVEVAKGAEVPLLRQQAPAQDVFGDSGLDGAKLPPPTQKILAKNTFVHLAEVITKNPKKVTLVATGPATNYAILFKAFPEVKANVEKIVMMGGAIKYGNVDPCAEFNIQSDPEAAQILLDSDVPVVLIPIEVTHTVLYNAKEKAKFEKDTPFIKALCGLLDFFEEKCRVMDGTDGAPSHDPCTIAYLIKPEIFECADAHVKVETKSDYCDGRTVIWFPGWRKDFTKKLNAKVATKVNSEAFWEIMSTAILKADKCSPLNEMQ